MIGTGTLINVGAVLLGSGIGLALKGGIRQKFQDVLMQALGMATMFIGLTGALQGLLLVDDGKLKTQGTLMLILSLVIGSFLGEWIDIEEKLENAGEWLKKKIKAQGESRFVDGFVTSSLIICVGAMAVVGSIQDGLTGDASMLIAKSLLDFVIVIIFSSTMGVGVLFSFLSVGIYQGSITLCAALIEPWLTDTMIANMSFVGSVLIFGIGVNISFGKKFKVGNMLPAILLPVAWEIFQMFFKI